MIKASYEWKGGLLSGMADHQIVLFENIVAARLSNMTYAQSEKTAENIAEKLIESYRLFNHRDVTLIYSSKAIAIPLGGEIKESDTSSPSLLSHPLDDIKDADQLDFSKAVFSNNERAQILFEAAQLIDRAIGKEAYIRFSIGGPFTVAAHILSPEKLLKSMIKNKKEVHRLIEHCLNLQMEMVDHFSQIESLVFHVADPMASTNLISPKFYREFALPYCKLLVDKIHSHDKEATLHICGDTIKILPAMLETGADVLSLDQAVDLEEASRILGDRAAILGNVDPLHILKDGNAEEIERAVRSVVDQAGSHPGGFILGPGCDIPFDTPEDNLHFFIEVGKKYL